jgi:hypothetical protein
LSFFKVVAMLEHFDKLQTSYAWLAWGAELLPIQPQSKKILRGWGSRQRRIRSRSEALFWFDGPWNLGLALVNGWVCADFDDLATYETWAAGPGAGAVTYAELTGRGAHVVWRSAGDIPSGSWPEKKNPPDIAMMTGGYVVIAPSMHPSGNPYRVLVDLPPAHLSIDRAVQAFPFLERRAPQVQACQPLSINGGHSKIQVIKDRFSIFDELTAAGAKGWRPAGGAVVACCPWHPDKHPSLWVLPHVKIWGCNVPGCPAFGRHDVINVRMLRGGLTAGEAIAQMWSEIQP